MSTTCCTWSLQLICNHLHAQNAVDGEDAKPLGSVILPTVCLLSCSLISKHVVFIHGGIFGRDGCFGDGIDGVVVGEGSGDIVT